jgi:hypothetical protein
MTDFRNETVGVAVRSWWAAMWGFEWRAIGGIGYSQCGGVQ